MLERGLFYLAPPKRQDLLWTGNGRSFAILTFSGPFSDHWECNGYVLLITDGYISYSEGQEDSVWGGEKIDARTAYLT